MPRKADAAEPEQRPDLLVYKTESGASLYQTRDGMVFSSEDEARAYMSENAVTILVNEFMDHVEENASKYFANKKGEMPEKERALIALKTRMRNTATKAFTWYLSTHE